jgi:hypothetical protein
MRLPGGGLQQGYLTGVARIDFIESTRFNGEMAERSKAPA